MKRRSPLVALLPHAVGIVLVLAAGLAWALASGTSASASWLPPQVRIIPVPHNCAVLDDWKPAVVKGRGPIWYRTLWCWHGDGTAKYVPAVVNVQQWQPLPPVPGRP